MRRAGLALSVLLCCAPPAVRAGSQDFALVNRTGYPIESITINEPGGRHPGNNVLGRDRLEDGETVAITFPRDMRGCRWDVVVQFRDRDRATWNNLDLCNISRVAVFWDKRTRATFARAE